MIINNSIELINKINSNMNLTLEKGEYIISNVVIEDDEFIQHKDVHDGKELVINNISNLAITAKEDVSILVEPRYAFIFTFKNCNNIKLKNLIIGHTIEKGYCMGGVLKFENCINVEIEECKLFGCGTVGIDIKNSKDIKLVNSEIYECTNGIMYICGSEDIEIKNCNLYDNEGFDMINIYNSGNVSFKNVQISNNKTIDQAYKLFNISKSSIKLINTYIRNNEVKSIADTMYKDIFNGIDLSDNICSGNMFDDKENYISKVSIPLDGNKKIIYDNDSISIIEEKIVDNGLPSKPEVSLDLRKLIYLAPFDFETFADLYIYDIESDHRECIVKSKFIKECVKNKNYKMKQVIWLNENEIAMIIGFGYGTVSQGGDVYIYSLTNAKLRELYRSKEGTEIVKIEKYDNKLIGLQVIFDDNLNISEYKNIIIM